MNALVPFGRFLFSLIFITGSLRHFTKSGIAHAAELGVPVADFLVPAAGLLALVSGVLLAVGYKTKWAAWGLIAFLVPVTLWMHVYWTLANPEVIHIQQAMFAKNLSMIGAALLIAHFGAGPFSFDQQVRKS